MRDASVGSEQSAAMKIPEGVIDLRNRVDAESCEDMQNLGAMSFIVEDHVGDCGAKCLGCGEVVDECVIQAMFGADLPGERFEGVVGAFAFRYSPRFRMMPEGQIYNS